MTQPALSESLRGFLVVFVHTFEDLEVLLLAHRMGEALLSAEYVATTLNLDLATASETLTGLAALGLLRVVSRAPLVCQFAPPAELRELVEEFAKAYGEQRVAVITAVASNAIVRIRASAIKTFAQAFVLRKEPKK